MVFVGNFRHLPNVEAVEHLCHAVVPRLDPDLLAQHPVQVIGTAWRTGWSVRPSSPTSSWSAGFPRSTRSCTRPVCVVPLLHGAGVKGKVIQSLLAGTPVVSTPVGVEGLELPDDGVAPVVVAHDAAEMAAELERLLIDDEAWAAHRDAGLAWAREHHSPEVVDRAVRRAVIEAVRRRRGRPIRAGLDQSTLADGLRRGAARGGRGARVAPGCSASARGHGWG